MTREGVLAVLEFAQASLATSFDSGLGQGDLAPPEPQIGRTPSVGQGAATKEMPVSPSSLAKATRKAHDFGMSTVTIALPDPLDAALLERMTAVGARSKEEYLLALIESDCAASELERVLLDRLAGPFEPLEIDWKQRVRQSAQNSR